MEWVELMPLSLISILAFWKPNPVLFMLAGGMVFMTGFYWYDCYTTNIGLSIGLCLIGYGLYCEALALRTIFWSDK